MKTIAVPISGGGFSLHFGGAETFALFRVDESARVVQERRSVAPPEHGRGVFPMWLRQQGADVVLAGGMGPRAVGILAQHGIEVILGIEGTDPEALVRDYLAGDLQTSGTPCQDHGFHDCGHHGHEDHDGPRSGNRPG